LDFEYTILDFIRNTFSCDIMDTVMKGITFLGDGGWFWIVLGVVLAVLPETRKIGFTLCGALILSLIFCNLTLKPLISRARPYEIAEGIKLIISPPGDYSFPSGHTSASFAGAVAVFIHNKKFGSIALVLAGLIAFSRLYLYVHFPTDVLGGAIVGTGCAVLSYFLLKHFTLGFSGKLFNNY